MSDVRSYYYNKNGLRIKYTVEYRTWQDNRGYGPISEAIIPAEFMPLPAFESHSFSQTVKYRIKNGDWFGVKERRQQQAILAAHATKRSLAWAQKLAAVRRQREAAACTPERLSATGVDKLLRQIRTAKNIDVECVCNVDDSDDEQKIGFVQIDDMEIELNNRRVVRDGVMVLEIPESQVCAVKDAINTWQAFVMKNGRRVK